MQKKCFQAVLMLASVLVLSSCTTSVDPPKNEPLPGLVIEAEPDPVKTVTDSDNGNDVTNSENGENNTDDNTKKPVEIPVTVAVELQKNGIPEEAKESGVIIGYDKDFNVIWEYKTEEVYVGQYENISYPELTENGVYFTCGTKLYCIDTTTENYGNLKWVNEANFGTGCCMTFDEEGNVYVMAYENPGYFIVDKDGQTVNRIEQFKFEDENDYSECFWPYFIEYVDGYIIVYFESNGEARVFRASDGFEGMPSVDCSGLFKDWKLLGREVEGEWINSGELNADFEIEFDEELNCTFTINDGSKKEFKNMPTTLKIGDMYSGIETSEYGRWYLECEYDETNSFAISLSGEDKLEVFWYNGIWDEEQYPVVVWLKYAITGEDE